MQQLVKHPNPAKSQGGALNQTRIAPAVYIPDSVLNCGLKPQSSKPYTENPESQNPKPVCSPEAVNLYMLDWSRYLSSGPLILTMRVQRVGSKA